MFPSAGSWKRAPISTTLLLSLPSLQLVTAFNQVYGRSVCDIAPTLDGPTSDNSPGIGVEFETNNIRFENSECSYSDTDAAKGRSISGRTADDWELTADTTVDAAGILQAEYILDGTKIKIGTGRAESAAAELRDDLYDWDPASGDTVDVDGNACNPWEVKMMGGIDYAVWSRQITAPLPLEAINDLMYRAVVGQASPLLGSVKKHIVWVHPDFFRDTEDDVGEDVRGFLGLILSYAKASQFVTPNSSPKFLTSIMPRTDFVTMYDMVKDALDEPLWDVVKQIACYRNEPQDGEEEYFDIDGRFCSGSFDDPTLGDEFEQLAFQVCNGADDECRVSIGDWIQGLEDGEDMLTKADEKFDGQIGGLGDVTEQVLDTDRAAPLFEFRDLGGSTANDFEKFVGQAEGKIIEYHKTYANAPRMRRSHFKRQESGSSSLPPCPAPTSMITSSITPTSTETLTVTPTTTPEQVFSIV